MTGEETEYTPQEDISKKSEIIAEIGGLFEQYDSGVLSRAQLRDKLVEREMHLENQLDYDEATGILTQRGLKHAWTRLIEVKSRQRRIDPSVKIRGAVIALDGDDLKGANTKGRHVGDAYIVHIAHVGSSTIRPTDLFARYGDKADEFCGYLDGVGEEEATVVALRTWKKVRETPNKILGDNKIAPSVSIGIAFFPEDIDYERLSDPEYQIQLFDKTFKKADKALKGAKDAGKDTIGLYEEGQNGPNIKVLDFAQMDFEGNVSQHHYAAK